MAPDACRPSDPEVLREASAEARRGQDAAARLLRRRSDTGLLKTGFEPQRHTGIVAGRPVQVLGEETHSTLQGPSFCFFSI